MIIKAGTYRFNETLNFDALQLGETTNFVERFYELPFSIPHYTRHLTQVEADEVNSYVASYGIVGDAVEGAYTISAQFNQMQVTKYVSNDGYTYRLVYDGGVTTINPNCVALMALTRTWDEVYFSYLVNGTNWQSSLTIPNFRIFVLDNDINVENNFGVWFTTNTERVIATIEYNGSTIAQLNAGETATLSCVDKKMVSDVVVKVNKIEEPVDDSIVGTWVFNDTIDTFDYNDENPLNSDFNFICSFSYIDNGKAYYHKVLFTGINIYSQQLEFESEIDGCYAIYSYPFEQGWNDENMKTIDILTDPKNEAFTTWLKANATKQ